MNTTYRRPWSLPQRETRNAIPKRRMGLLEIILIAGLLLMPLQVVRLSIAQPAHLWVLIAFAMMLFYDRPRVSATELIAYTAFIYFTLALTFMQDYTRIKEMDQVIKFMLFYPAFYVVGKWLGLRFGDRALPLGYSFLFIFLIFQYSVQALHLPVIYEEISFGQGALHGTFRERNWLAVYFFLFSYVLLMRNRSNWGFLLFFGLNVAVMLLSGSKTTFVAVGIVFLLQSRLPLWIRILPIIIGAMFYLSIFSEELTGDKLAIKLEEERGLAFTVSLDLLRANPIGYGLGFVEAFFSNTWIVVKGLGEGTNSVFSVPLDLWIIAGPFGFALWLVIFAGVGNSATKVLAPIAALSLLNPLHQSELVYFFMGFLVSQDRFLRLAPVRARQITQRSTHPEEMVRKFAQLR
ncbi:hypothetical protein ABVB72_22810 [Rhizobium nepotum]|uniref:hypothetical protein n=1 Tax=Rhizobium nepotum TaxID=1035271 RepID=UPI003369C3EE